jgi:hypothetical protein
VQHDVVLAVDAAGRRRTQSLRDEAGQRGGVTAQQVGVELARERAEPLYGWTGNAWHASGFPAKLILDSAADVGPGDVWAFGVTRPTADTTTPYAARFNGQAWHKVALPIAPLASGTAKGILWAVGPTTATASRPPGKQRIMAGYWNGRSWRTLAMPKLKIPAEAASLMPRPRTATAESGSPPAPAWT